MKNIFNKIKNLFNNITNPEHEAVQYVLAIGLIICGTLCALTLFTSFIANYAILVYSIITLSILIIVYAFIYIIRTHIDNYKDKRLQEAEELAEKVKYIGVFFDANDLPKGTLSKDITHKHITLKYKPTANEIKVYNALLGTEAECSLIGYGNDGANEGLFVTLDNTIPYMGADRSHITLSIAEGAKAVNTAFVPMTEKRAGTLKGRVGYFMVDGTIMFNKEK